MSSTPKYDELRAVVAAVMAPEDYVLAGSACLAARRIRDVNDLDVLIKPELWDLVHAMQAQGRWPSKPFEPFTAEQQENYIGPDLPDGTPAREILRTGWMDFGDSPPRIMGSVSREAIFEAAQVIDGVQVMSLRHCLAIKALANRRKDHDDMVKLSSLIAYEEAPPDYFDF